MEEEKQVEVEKEEVVDITTSEIFDKSILNNLIKKLDSAEGYLITYTTRNKDKLEHSFITYHFDKVDILPSHKRTKELLIQELER